MPAMAIVTLVKTMPYRASNAEEFSNTYHFHSPPPSTSTEWDSLFNQIVALEQPLYDPLVKWVRGIGHANSDPGSPAVYEKDFTTPGPPPAGTFNDVTGQIGAGDQAAVVEWPTDQKSVRGKQIYLRKYHHRPHVAPATPDSLTSAYAVQLDTYGAAFTNVQPWGGLTNPAGSANVTGHRNLGYVTTRTLKRRGKRKKVA